jgi:hypothetical protein
MTIATFNGKQNVDVTVDLALGGLAAILAAELDWIDPNTYSVKPIQRTDKGGAPTRSWLVTTPQTAVGPASFRLIVTPATIGGPATVNATVRIRQSTDLSGTDENNAAVNSPWVVSISTTTASAIEFNIAFS